MALVRTRGSCVALLLGLLCGCSGDGRDSTPPTHAVTGRVFIDRKPAGRVVIVLHPLDAADDKAPKAYARSEPDGTFRMSTFKPGDGVPKGRYAVTCVLTDHEDGGNVLPGRYASPKTSGLRVEIREGPNDLEPLHLSGQ